MKATNGLSPMQNKPGVSVAGFSLRIELKKVQRAIAGIVNGAVPIGDIPLSDCVSCGSNVQNKNSAGHYRDLCCECILLEADGTDSDRPIPGCECEQCQEAKEG
jgi:Zn ribbon nucleic-acid-binding protein